MYLLTYNPNTHTHIPYNKGNLMGQNAPLKPENLRESSHASKKSRFCARKNHYGPTSMHAYLRGRI